MNWSVQFGISDTAFLKTHPIEAFPHTFRGREIHDAIRAVHELRHLGYPVIGIEPVFKGSLNPIVP